MAIKAPNPSSIAFDFYDPLTILEDKNLIKRLLSSEKIEPVLENLVENRLYSIVGLGGIGSYQSMKRMTNAGPLKKKRTKFLRTQLYKIYADPDCLRDEIGNCFAVCSGLSFMYHEQLLESQEYKHFFQGIWQVVKEFDLEAYSGPYSDAVRKHENIAMKETITCVLALIANAKALCENKIEFNFLPDLLAELLPEHEFLYERMHYMDLEQATALQKFHRKFGYIRLRQVTHSPKVYRSVKVDYPDSKFVQRLCDKLIRRYPFEFD